MEGHLLLTFLRNNRIGLKYTLFTVIILVVLGVLAAEDVFAGIENSVNSAMDTLADYGLIGMFTIALFSNMTLVIQVPYNLPMFTLIVYADSILDVLALGVATGIGSGIGATASYAVARTIVARVEDLEKSALFRWVKSKMERHPILIPFLIFLGSGTPVPDFSFIVPLAMIKYPWKNVLIPMVAGKIFQNVIIALLFRYAANSANTLVANSLNFDLTAGIVIIFLMVIGYQIEKGRADQGTNGSAHAAAERENSIAAD
jgi:membrane protein YqaA with SNARE-associated domain